MGSPVKLELLNKLRIILHNNIKLRKILRMKEIERFNMVLPKWLKDAIKEAAELKGVGMSEYVKDALKDAVKRDLPNKPEATD